MTNVFLIHTNLTKVRLLGKVMQFIRGHKDFMEICIWPFCDRNLSAKYSVKFLGFCLL